MKRVTSHALGLLRRRFHRVLERHACRTTDHFAGFQITGRFHTAALVELLAMLPQGSTRIHVPSRPVRPGFAGSPNAIERKPRAGNWKR